MFSHTHTYIYTCFFQPFNGRRPRNELVVLQDAYTSCVASAQDHQHQQLRESDEAEEEGIAAQRGVPEGTCPLQQIEGLLQPMVSDGNV